MMLVPKEYYPELQQLAAADWKSVGYDQPTILDTLEMVLSGGLAEHCQQEFLHDGFGLITSQVLQGIDPLSCVADVLMECAQEADGWGIFALSLPEGSEGDMLAALARVTALPVNDDGPGGPQRYPLTLTRAQAAQLRAFAARHDFREEAALGVVMLIGLHAGRKLLIPDQTTADA